MTNSTNARKGVYLPADSRFPKSGTAGMRMALGRGLALNPQFVKCMFASTVVGFGAAAGVLLSGWHTLLALPAFSLCGSLALFGLTLLLTPGSSGRKAGAISPRISYMPEVPQST